MKILIALIPLILLVIVYAVVCGLIAAYAKLASRILHKEAVSWRRSTIFSLAIIALTVLGRIVSIAANVSIPLTLALAISFVLYLTLGGWLFSRQGVTKDGQPLGWFDGARIGVFAFLLITLTGFMAYGTFHVLSLAIHP
jgi:hypothetical protein